MNEALRLITCELAYCGTRHTDTEARRKAATMKLKFPDLTAKLGTWGEHSEDQEETQGKTQTAKLVSKKHKTPTPPKPFNVNVVGV